MKNGSAPTRSAPSRSLREGLRRRRRFALVAGVEDLNLLPDDARRRLHVSDLPARRSDCSDSRARRSRRLWAPARAAAPAASPPARLRGSHAGDVAARPVEAGDKADLTGSPPTTNTIGIVVVAALAASAAALPPCDDHRHLAADQIGRQRRQSIVLTFRPAIFDRDVLALDIAGLLQALAERGHACAPIVTGRSAWRNPITGIAGCCARAASGHALLRRPV